MIEGPDRAWQRVLAKPLFVVCLPFPSADLSGHHNRHWRKLQPVKKQHREMARIATLEVMQPIIGKADIPVHVRFVPPDKRGDRFNFPNRMKPYIDGIADAMQVNDRRFLPSFEYCPPLIPGMVEVEVYG